MKNIVISIQNKLLALSKAQGKEHIYTLIRYFQERLLYRISMSKFTANFILKGGAFMYAIQNKQSRLTKDIDLKGSHIQNDLSVLKTVFEDISVIPCEDDGVIFDTTSVQTEIINEQGKYSGVRVYILANLGKQQQKIQIDIGFGDVVTPAPQTLEYPTLLENFEPFPIQAYTIETVIAEKFQAMIDLGLTNSRMKDFYDVYGYFIGNQYNIEVLKIAITQTFKNRQTTFTENHPLWTTDFYVNVNRLQQWKAFLKKTNLDTNLTFEVVIKMLQTILKPIYESLR